MAPREQLEARIRALCEAGDKRRAATLLLEGYGAELLGFLLARLRDRDAAAEVFSAFTEDMWRGLDGFGWRCTARVWAYTLARHAASHYLRQAHRRRERPLASGALSAIEQQIRTESSASARSEAKSQLVLLRERLPRDDQLLLILRVNRQLAWTEIAQVMLHEGEVVDTAQLEREAARLRQRYQKAKHKLKALAIEAGLVTARD
ncbi:MAG TPA: hypothetical protein VJR89_07995 [Polyangiales bacterium]|nr:hypothetical protein [Polyangiales bacterium]